MNTNLEAMNLHLNGLGLLATIDHLINQAVWLSEYDLEQVEKLKQSIREAHGVQN